MASNLDANDGKSLILHVLSEVNRPMTPKEVYRHKDVKNNLSYSTVKVYLRQLYLEKEINQYFNRGPYEVRKPTYEGGEVGDDGSVAVHNFRLQVLGDVGKGGVFETSFGNVSVYITFGKSSGKVTGIFGKRDGLTYSELLLSLDLFWRKCEEVLACPVEKGDVNCLFYEIADDHHRMRIDKTVTFTDFSGIVERVYQKDASTVRREVSVKNTSVEAVLALYRGGFDRYHIVRRLERIESEISDVKKVLKFSNRNLADLLAMERERLKRGM